MIQNKITVAAVVSEGRHLGTRVVIAITVAAGAVILSKTRSKANSLDLDQTVG